MQTSRCDLPLIVTAMLTVCLMQADNAVATATAAKAAHTTWDVVTCIVQADKTTGDS